ncbi:MAG: carbon-nitrogen hydrolase family protein [Candidatus Polarisedimenticolia bacterium]
MQRIRVASLQYYIRPVQTFEQFRDQVEALVETATDNRCHLLVFPEYFTVQLLTLGSVKRPIHEQIRDLARQSPRFVELMSGLARSKGLYIAAGTIPVVDAGSEAVYNQGFLFSPLGEHGTQKKLHLTRFETEEWLISPGTRLRVFDTALGKLAITICYDIEFPELARAAARQGAILLIVPSCTDDRQGFLRVRYCAQARAIENQVYVIQASTVGSLPMVPAVSLNYGQASILTPSDFAFSRDGILAEGTPNQESMIIGELNLQTILESRDHGTVLPLRDSSTTAEVASKLEVLPL